MSNICFIEKLLDNVEVEWKPMAVLGELVRGNGLPKKDFTDSGVPAIHYGQIYTYYDLTTISTISFVSHETAMKLKKVVTGDVIITNTSENIEDVGTSLVYLGKQQAVTGGHATIFKPNESVLGKYFAYFTQTGKFAIAKRKYAKGAKVIDVSAKDMAKISIPIPCPENLEKSLKIQTEIVRILDTFYELTTKLTTELTTELNARNQQYYYYHEQLLLGSEAKVEKLEDIAEIYLGLTYTPTYVDEGVKFISARNTSKDFLDLSNVKYISEDEYQNSTLNAKPKRGDVLFTRVGSNLGHPVIVDTDEPLCMFVSLGFIRVNTEKVLNSYIKHWINTDLFWAQVRKKTHGAAKINLNTGWLKKFDVPLPSINEQKRIVTILDKFNDLNKSIIKGLSHEIKMRQKQYDYYCNLLLSFPKPEEVSASL